MGHKDAFSFWTAYIQSMHKTTKCNAARLCSITLTFSGTGSLDCVISPRSQSFRCSEATAQRARRQLQEIRRRRLTSRTDVGVKTFFMKCLFQWMGSDLGFLSVPFHSFAFCLSLTHTHAHISTDTQRTNTLVNQSGWPRPYMYIKLQHLNKTKLLIIDINDDQFLVLLLKQLKSL